MTNPSVNLRSFQKAFVSFKLLIILAFVGLFLYVGYYTSVFYVDYYRIENAVKDNLREAKRVKRPILAKTKTLDIINKTAAPVDEKDIELIQEDGQLRMKINYSEYLDLFGYELYEFKFKIDESQALD